MKVQIRKMEERDISKIYEFIHKKYVEKYHAECREKQWQSHYRWYCFVLHSSSYAFYILEEGEDFVGTVRYELEEGKAVVSIYLREEYRGRGYAKYLLQESLKELMEEVELTEIEADILEENNVSQNLFLDCGFIQDDTEQFSYQVKPRKKV